MKIISGKAPINEPKVDQIEVDYLKRLNSSVERFYVPIFDEKQKIWCLSANTKSTNTPLVLVLIDC
jgi:hypothetical protein